MCIRGQIAWGVSDVFSLIATLSSLSHHFPRVSTLSILIRLCTSSQILIQDILYPLSCAKWYTKVFGLLSCSPTLSASLKVSRIVNNHMSFSNLSSSSSFLIWVSASMWASVSSYGPHWKPAHCSSHLFPFFTHSALCAVHQANTLKQPAFPGCPCAHVAFHRHLT